MDIGRRTVQRPVPTKHCFSVTWKNQMSPRNHEARLVSENLGIGERERRRERITIGIFKIVDCSRLPWRSAWAKPGRRYRQPFFHIPENLISRCNLRAAARGIPQPVTSRRLKCTSTCTSTAKGVIMVPPYSYTYSYTLISFDGQDPHIQKFQYA